MEAAAPRRSIVGLGLVATALSLVVLWPGGAGAIHTPDAPAFAPIIDYKLCNDLPTEFDGPLVLQGYGGACDEVPAEEATPDLTFDLDIPAGHLNFSPDTLILTLSGEFDIAADIDIRNGIVVAGVDASVLLGLINAPCNNTVTSQFILYDATADPGNLLVMTPSTIIVFDGFDPYDGKADGFSPVVMRYPDFNNNFFDPDGSGDSGGGYSPIAPHARYAGASEIWGEWVLFQIFIFQPGALKAAFSANPANVTHPFSRLHSNLGWTAIVLLNSPAGYSSIPSATTDFCTPLSITGALLGQVDTDGDTTLDTDRLTSPAGVGGIDGEGTQLAQLYALSIRDLDEDGIDNSLDTCPNDSANVEDPWNSNGTDGDGLDPVCDPNPGETSPAAPAPNGIDDDGDTLVDEDPTDGFDNDGDTLIDEDGECPDTFGLPDEDQDCYPNRQDNCPIAANASQTESEFTTPRDVASPDGGPWNDRLGDPCDAEPTVANGLFFHAFETDAFCINDTPGADYDEDGWCSAGADPDDNDPTVTGAEDQDADAHLFVGQPGHSVENVREIWMQTDPLADCAEVEGKHDAWPSDFDMDRDVDVGDVIIGFNGRIFSPENYQRRSDADMDGDIDIGDLLQLMGGDIMLTSCTPPP